MVTKKEIEEAKKEYDKLRKKEKKFQKEVREFAEKTEEAYIKFHALKDEYKRHQEITPDKEGFLRIEEGIENSGYSSIFLLGGKKLKNGERVDLKMKDGTIASTTARIRTECYDRKESAYRDCLSFAIVCYGTELLVEYVPGLMAKRIDKPIPDEILEPPKRKRHRGRTKKKA